MAGPLTGIRVLELGSFIAGPFAGQLLGDYGAEVIKVEPPSGGDPMRKWGHRDSAGHSYWWPAIARNKKSIAIDLRIAEGRMVVRRLASRSDVVLENFTPGRLAEWQLGYDDLVERFADAQDPGSVENDWQVDRLPEDRAADDLVEFLAVQSSDDDLEHEAVLLSFR